MARFMLIDDPDGLGDRHFITQSASREKFNAKIAFIYIKDILRYQNIHHINLHETFVLKLYLWLLHNSF